MYCVLLSLRVKVEGQSIGYATEWFRPTWVIMTEVVSSNFQVSYMLVVYIFQCRKRARRWKRSRRSKRARILDAG